MNPTLQLKIPLYFFVLPAGGRLCLGDSFHEVNQLLHQQPMTETETGMTNLTSYQFAIARLWDLSGPATHLVKGLIYLVSRPAKLMLSEDLTE